MGQDSLDTLPEAVVVVDGDRRVRAVNDRAAAMLGLDGSAVGQLLGGVLTLVDEDGAVCPDPVPRRGTADRIAERVWYAQLADGRRRAVAMAGRHLGDGAVTLTFRTAGRRLAAERGQADVVATVSHELRTPLATVRGFARTMHDGWDRLSDDKKLTFLAAIVEDADRVGRLLGELLEVSRIDARRMRLRLSSVDLGLLATSVAEKASARPSGEGRVVQVIGAAGRGASVVRADRDRIEQILTNLVENALIHAPRAEVVVEVHAPTDGRAAVTVADDGPGVPPDIREQIFQKFGRGRQSRRSGTGLGLYIARGLARAHGGDLTLGDADRGGTVFRLEIPIDTTGGER